MGQTPSNDCWSGVRTLLKSSNQPDEVTRHPKTTSLPSSMNFKVLKHHRNKDFVFDSVAGYLEFDPRLQVDSKPQREASQIIDKIATVLYAHIDRRVFSSPEDDAYHIGHFHWTWTYCLKTHTNLDVSEEDIRDRVNFLKREIKLCPEILVISLIYIERLLNTKKTQFTPANWEVILTAGIVLATKVWEDIHPWNIDFEVALSGLRKSRNSAHARGAFSAYSIYQMESRFLNHINFNVHVSGDAYAHYLFNLTEGGGNPLEILDKIEEEVDVKRFLADDGKASPRWDSCPMHVLDLHAATRTLGTSPQLHRGFGSWRSFLPSATPAGFGRLDPRNPYVGTFQHAKPTKKPSGSCLSGDLSCLCNMKGKCHLCVRREKIAFAIKENSSMRKCTSWCSLATSAVSTVTESDASSVCDAGNDKHLSTLTLTGATGKYLAKELKLRLHPSYRHRGRRDSGTRALVSSFA